MWNNGSGYSSFGGGGEVVNGLPPSFYSPRKQQKLGVKQPPLKKNNNMGGGGGVKTMHAAYGKMLKLGSGSGSGGRWGDEGGEGDGDGGGDGDDPQPTPNPPPFTPLPVDPLVVFQKAILQGDNFHQATQLNALIQTLNRDFVLFLDDQGNNLSFGDTIPPRWFMAYWVDSMKYTGYADDLANVKYGFEQKSPLMDSYLIGWYAYLDKLVTTGGITIPSNASVQPSSTNPVVTFKDEVNAIQKNVLRPKGIDKTFFPSPPGMPDRSSTNVETYPVPNFPDKPKPGPPKPGPPTPFPPSPPYIPTDDPTKKKRRQTVMIIIATLILIRWIYLLITSEKHREKIKHLYAKAKAKIVHHINKPATPKPTTPTPAAPAAPAKSPTTITITTTT